MTPTLHATGVEMATTAKLIALAGGRAFTLRVAANTDLQSALHWLTWQDRGRRNEPAPDHALEQAWLDTEEGFRIRAEAVTAFVIGEKQGEWAVAAT
jgi:hypothetical protein